MENPFKPTRAKGSATDSDQFIGAYVSEELAEHLALLAIFRGLPKVAIMEQAIQLYTADTPVKIIMPYLITRASETWHSELRLNEGKVEWKTAIEKEKKLIAFKTELRIYLKKQATISHTRISEILDRIE